MALISIRWCEFALLFHRHPSEWNAFCVRCIKQTNRQANIHNTCTWTFFSSNREKKNKLKCNLKGWNLIQRNKKSNENNNNKFIFVNKIVIYIWICISRRVYIFEMLTFFILSTFSPSIHLLSTHTFAAHHLQNGAREKIHSITVPNLTAKSN